MSEYNRELSLEHSYLGDDLVDIKGRITLVDDDLMQIVIIRKKLVLIPGQTIPLVLHHHDNHEERQMIEDKVFGVLYSTNKKFGTLAEIRSFKSESLGENGALKVLTVRAIGRQRFEVVTMTGPQGGPRAATVRLLPEIVLLKPHAHLLLEGGRNREHVLKCLPWPKHLNKICDTDLLVKDISDRIRKFLGKEPPETDVSSFSFWTMAELPINDKDRERLLTTRCVQERLIGIKEALKKECGDLICSFCQSTLASPSDIFLMCSGGSQAVFVNKYGIIHEMITCRDVFLHGVQCIGGKFEEMSWFPGYAWTVMHCGWCAHHLGWHFTALSDLQPKQFWAFSRSNARFGPSRGSGRCSRRHMSASEEDMNRDDSGEDDLSDSFDRVNFELQLDAD